MIYHFPTEFFNQNLSLRIKKTSVTTALRIRSRCIVIRKNQLKRPFVTSCRILNANPRVNVYFIALSSVNMLFSKTGLVIAPFIKKTYKFY